MATGGLTPVASAGSVAGSESEAVMIRIIEGMPEGVLGFEANGKLTADDYTQVLAPAIQNASAGTGKIRLLLDFGGKFDGMEAGAVWGPQHGRSGLECLGTHRPGHRPQVD